VITVTECKRFTDFIGRKATDTYDLENGRRVKVYTSHYKGSKAIVTVVKECSISYSGSFTMERWRQGIDTMDRVSVIPCARYSNKALEEAHAAGVMAAAELVRQLLEKNATMEREIEE
jgi:hypothetical protein